MLNQPNTESLSVILAAYNEAENLSFLLPRLISILNQITSDNEILVVDTQQPMDNTREICEMYSVKYLNRQGSNNYGDAIRTGIKNSSGKYVIIMDSDGSHNPEFINELWKARGQAEVIIASRYLSGGKTNNPWMLVFMSKILNLFFKYFVRIPALDVSNSFRLYDGDRLRSLKLEFSHFDIVEEILAKMIWEIQPPSKVLELPFEFGKRISGKSKRNLLVFSYNFLLAIFRLNQIRKDAKRNAFNG